MIIAFFASWIGLVVVGASWWVSREETARDSNPA